MVPRKQKKQESDNAAYRTHMHRSLFWTQRMDMAETKQKHLLRADNTAL